MKNKFIALLALISLSACGGGGGSSGPPKYSVGGAISGLISGASLTLRNGADTLNLSTNGSFVFSSTITQGGSYAVEIVSQPTGQTCSVTNGSGVISAAVSNILVTCVTNTYAVSGSASGVAANQPLSLSLNGGETLSLNKDGGFAFSSKVSHGSAFSVLVSKQPLGQTCNVSGGSGTVSGPISSVTVTCSPQPYFAELPGVFSISYPPDTSSIVTIETADINGDKKLDLLVHYLGGRYTGKSVGNLVAPNAVRIYVQQVDGRFEDQTSDLLVGGDNLGGWSRKLKIADVNGDGKADFLFAINQEDGRLQANATDMNAQMAAIVSTKSKYVVSKFGVPSWYHSVGVGRDSRGSIFVTGNGYTFSGNNRIGYVFDENGVPTAGPANLPNVSPTTFELFNSAGDQAWTSQLLQANNSSTSYLDVEGYSQQSDGSWKRLPNLSFAGIAGEFTAINYTGEAGPGVAFNLDGTYLSWAGLSESCQIKLAPSGENIVLFALGGGVIPNFRAGMTYKQNDSKAFRTTRAAKIENGQIVQVPLRFVNEQTANVNSNFFDCADVNGDRYSDIVVYRYNTTDNSEYIHVYLNDQSNGFKYIGQNAFPPFPFLGNQGWSSLLRDFDQDGITDLLLYPSSTTSASWRFYRGLKTLQ
jgi:hypothetical protein